MWNEKKPWWQKPKGDPRKAVDREYAKNWCVIKVMGWVMMDKNGLIISETTSLYKACATLNAPKYFTNSGEAEDSAVMSNLTKQEAYECAKGLNFLDGQND